MRCRNLRVVIVGAVLVVLAAAFFLVMAAISPKSNDPAALMETVGQVSGVLVGLDFVMMIVADWKKTTRELIPYRDLREIAV